MKKMDFLSKETLFTSDWHLGDDRLGLTPDKPNVFLRPFKSIQEQNETILRNVNAVLTPQTTLYHLGDVAITQEGIDALKGLKSCKKRVLVLGNYDDGKEAELGKYFDAVVKALETKQEHEGERVYLDHYPANCLPYIEKGYFALTGHIHGSWRVQPNMINVGVDAWNYAPVDGETIRFVQNAMRKHYDKHVFPFTLDLQRK